MAGPVLDERTGLAYVYDRLTGQVFNWRVPTAVENVDRNPDRYGHGQSCPPGERIKADPSVGRGAPEAAPPGMNNGAMPEDGTLDMPREPDPMVAMLTSSNEQLRAENAELLADRTALRERVKALETDLAAASAGAAEPSVGGADEAAGGQVQDAGEEPAAQPPAADPPKPKPAARKAAAKRRPAARRTGK